MQEQFQARLKELTIQLQQAQSRLQQANADVIAISGAMQEIMYWQNKLEQEAKEADRVDDEKNANKQ